MNASRERLLYDIAEIEVTLRLIKEYLDHPGREDEQQLFGERMHKVAHVAHSAADHLMLSPLLYG